MSLRGHVAPTLHNAVGTIIATIVIAAAGASYIGLRRAGSVTLPIWMLSIIFVVFAGIIVWSVLSVRRSRRANAFFVHRATWGAGDHVGDVTDVVRSNVHDGTLSIRAGNDILGIDPCHGTGQYLKIEYSYCGKQLSRSVPESDTLTI